MTQHVWPDGRQTNPRRGAGNPTVQGPPDERLLALGDEQPGEPVGAAGKVSSDHAQFVAVSLLRSGWRPRIAANCTVVIGHDE